jgi:alkylhydroperoxidase family enzyme
MLNRQTEKEDTMALRVPKAQLSTEMRENMIERFGAVLEPVEVLWHSRKVTQDNLEFGGKVGEWNAADESLKSFAHMAVAAQVGCSWCLDIGYFQAQNENLDMSKASQVPRWRQADVFTPLERDVLEYAEAVTNTPPTVTAELSARLLDRLGPAAMIELTAFIAYSNLSTRSNAALGIKSQGFSAACEIPLAGRPETVAA